MTVPLTKTVQASQTLSDRGRWPLVLSAGVVLLFWWAATGFTFAMQASPSAIVVSLVTSALLAAVGLVFVVRSRTDVTARGARIAFLGSALLWWWCAVVFYAGWGVRLAGMNATQTIPARSWSLAIDAIAATWRADALGVAILALVFATVRRSPNRAAFWSLSIFWGTLQTAKLNVFFGVRNAGIELLPPHLAGLGAFFGPSLNSPLLVITLLALAALLLYLGNRVRHATSTFERHAGAMLLMLVALAFLEHAVLGASAALPLWNFFMATNT